MSITVAVRFPLGRYHANPWDRSVNEGAVEWPPSPWRLLRTLVSTWYTRWPDLPAPVLDQLLDALAQPPAFRTPPATSGHTRHYLPDAGHKKGVSGGTELTLDPYLWVPPADPLLIRWEAELDGEQRETLGKLVELVPYLGRAESVCEMRLVDGAEAPEPDGTWWRPESGGAETVRVLAPALPVRRALLELSTVEIRKQRRTMPPDTRWVVYSRTRPDATAAQPARAKVTEMDAIRFAVQSAAPVRPENGILLADEVHRIVTRILDGGRPDVLGHQGAATDHQHAHWVPLPDPDGTRVGSVLIWVPRTFTQDDIAAILAKPGQLREISGRRGGNGYEVKGLPQVDLLLQGVGPVATVAPQLCGSARRWRSLTPYLPVRHRKPNRETVDEHLAADVRKELDYRQESTPVTVSHDTSRPDNWALEYRRYRMKEHLGKARRGCGLRLEFETEVDGPLLLGQLSHFGYGIFVPEPG